MKKIGRIIFLVSLIAIILIGGPIVGSSLTKNKKPTDYYGLVQTFDRFNILKEKTNVYVIVNSKDAIETSFGGYDYKQEGINDSGEAQEIGYYSEKILKENAILKLETKGKYVFTWEEINEQNIPKNILNKL